MLIKREAISYLEEISTEAIEARIYSKQSDKKDEDAENIRCFLADDEKTNDIERLVL